jgi:hypothetical protein
MFADVRVIAALAALVTAVIGGTVGWQGAPAARGPVELRSTGEPMEPR